MRSRFAHAVLAILFVTGTVPVAAQANPPALRAGKPAPQIAGTTLDQKQITLASYRGKVVLLDFWASWCTPCLQQMPQFVHWQKQWAAQGLQIIGVSLDDDPKDARKIATRYRLNYPVLMGTPQMADQYGILGLPQVVLIGRSGSIAEVHSGEEPPENLHESIQKLLKPLQ